MFSHDIVNRLYGLALHFCFCFRISPANTLYWPDVGLLLVHRLRLRRWPNIKPTLGVSCVLILSGFIIVFLTVLQDILIGFMIGLALPCWFVIESLTTDYVAPTLPMVTSGCNHTTYDVTMTNSTVHTSTAQYLMTNSSTVNDVHSHQEKSVIMLTFFFFAILWNAVTSLGENKVI